MQKSFIIVLSLLLLSPLAHARLEYVSADLLLKNAEQFDAIVRKKIKRAQDIEVKTDPDSDGEQSVVEPAVLAALRDAMRITLSRPDREGARTRTFNKVRQELNDVGALDQALKEISTEAIAALKSGKLDLKVEETYTVILDNLLAEIKSEVTSHEGFKVIVEKIRDADIKLSNRSKDPNRTININVSPSKTAADIVPKK